MRRFCGVKIADHGRELIGRHWEPVVEHDNVIACVVCDSNTVSGHPVCKQYEIISSDRYHRVQFSEPLSDNDKIIISLGPCQPVNHRRFPCIWQSNQASI